MNVYHGNGPALAPGFQGCPGIHDTTGENPVYPRQNYLQTYLSVPFYAVGAILFGEDQTIPGRGGVWDVPWGPVVFVSMLNPLLAALTALLVALLAKEFGLTELKQYYLAVMFGLTTMIWHYAGLGMEIVQTAVLTMTVYSSVRYRMSGRFSWLISAILMILALPNCKKYSAIFLLPISIYLIWSVFKHNQKHRTRIVWIVISGLMLGIVVMVISVYTRFQSDPNLFPHLRETMLSGGFRSIDLLFGLTLSPGEGLLIFNPLVWFMIPAWGTFFRKFKPEALLFSGISLTLLTVLWRVPFVLIDEEWGPRYLLALLPFMFVAGSDGLFKKRNGFLKVVFLSILIISLCFNWISSMTLGFNVLDSALQMGVSDYFVLVFTPSMSQIWLSITCFVSYVRHLYTGKHLELRYRQYVEYTGIGGRYQILRQNLSDFDSLSGGIFIVRWVLSEMGNHGLTPKTAFHLKILMDTLLLGSIGYLLFRKRTQVRSVHQV